MNASSGRRTKARLGSAEPRPPGRCLEVTRCTGWEAQDNALVGPLVTTIRNIYAIRKIGTVVATLSKLFRVAFTVCFNIESSRFE
jgi:hypothetical protein